MARVPEVQRLVARVMGHPVPIVNGMRQLATSVSLSELLRLGFLSCLYSTRTPCVTCQRRQQKQKHTNTQINTSGSSSVLASASLQTRESMSVCAFWEVSFLASTERLRPAETAETASVVSTAGTTSTPPASAERTAHLEKVFSRQGSLVHAPGLLE